jgi:hypothetical protein
MMRYIMPVTAVLMLLAGASTTACGSAKPGDKPRASVSPSAKVPTAEELKKALLALSDMPTGYAAKPEKTPGGGGSPTPKESSSLAAPNAQCNQLFNEFDAEGSAAATEQASASAEFEKAATGPFVKQTLESYRDAAALQKDMARVREAVDKCGEFTVKEEDIEAKVRIANASFPKLGDDTAAFKLDAVVASGGRKVTLSGYMVAVRVGNVVTTITSFGVPNVDAGEIEQITRKAVDKFTPVAR